MTLQSQHIEIPLIGGVSTREAEQVVQSPKLIELKNADMSEPGKLKKRTGHTQVSTGGANVDALVADETSISIVDGGNLKTKETTSGAWRDGGYIESMQHSSKTLWSPGGSTLSSIHTAYANGCVCFVVRQSLFSNFYVARVHDVETGALLAEQQLTAVAGLVDADDARVVAIGDEFIVIYRDGTNLYGIKINSTTLSSGWSAATTIATSTVDSASPMDIATNGVDVYVLYKLSGSNIIQIRRVSTSLATEGSVNVSSGGGAVKAICVAYSALWARFIAAWSFTAGGAYWVDFTTAPGVSAGSTSLVSTTVIDQIAIGDGPSSNEALILYERNASTATTRQVDYRTVNWSTRTVSSTVDTIYGYGLAHKAFTYDGRVFVGLHFEGAYENVVIEAVWPVKTTGQELDLAGKMLGPIAGGIETAGTLGGPVQIESGRWVWCTRARVGIDADAGTVRYHALTMITMDLRADQNYQQVRVSGRAHVAGSVAHVLSEGLLVDVGFPHAPPPPVLTESSGGSLTSTGTYSYITMYEWHDSAGRVYRSPPSVPSTLTLTGTNQTIDVTSPGVFVSLQRRGSTSKWPFLAVFRTEASGTIYYRINGYALYPARHDQQVAYLDTTPDSGITDNEILYTTGGELDHYSPPPTAFLCNHQERIWAINSEDGTLWPSGLIQDAFTGPWWNPALAVLTARTGQVPTALASLDDKLVVFWEDSIGYLYGDGPDNTGQAGQFSPIFPVPSDVGCVNARSVVVTPLGAFFESRRGIYLLDRGLTVQFVGDAVEDLLPTIVAASLVPERHEVRFYGANGNVLVYEYLLQQWWLDVLPSTVTGAAVFDGAEYVAHGAELWTRGGTTDDGTAFAMSFKTPWINVAGLVGFQRVRRVFLLGEFPVSTMTVNLRYDGNSASSDTVTFTGSGSEEEVSIQVPFQKCRSLQIEVSGATAITRIRLEIGAKRGAYKPVTRRL